jgi:hypothetical protein
MYTKQDLIENKKMGEIIKANQKRVRMENIKRYKRMKRNEMFQQIFLFIVFMITVILVGLVENMTF